MEETLLIKVFTTDGHKRVVEYYEPDFKVIYNDEVSLIYRFDRFYENNMVEIISEVSTKELETFLKAKIEWLKSMGFTKLAQGQINSYSPNLFGFNLK